MLLDLSAAFDTIDQHKLLTIFHDEIGINGIALKWFASFLKGRNQKFKIWNAFSAEKEFDYGVPQGSVLGPDIFNIYTRSFHEYMVWHRAQYWALIVSIFIQCPFMNIWCAAGRSIGP